MQSEKSTAVFSNPYQAMVVLIALAIWCWVDVWPRGRLDPDRPHTHRTDFTVYTNAGKAALAGENPYSVTNARGWSYLYLPAFALIVSPLAILPEGWQCVVWFWISVACLYGAFREFALLDRWAFPHGGRVSTARLGGVPAFQPRFTEPEALADFLQRGSASASGSSKPMICLIEKWERLQADWGQSMLAHSSKMKYHFPS